MNTAQHNTNGGSIVKTDLMDYFPHLDPRIKTKLPDGSYKGYVGYKKQMCFQAMLKEAFAKAKELTEQELSKVNYAGSLMHQLRDEQYEIEAKKSYRRAYMVTFRDKLNCEIEKNDWVRWDRSSYDNLIEEFESKRNQYLKGAAKAVTLNVVEDKIGDGAGSYLKNKVGKGMYRAVGKMENGTAKKATLMAKQAVTGTSRMIPKGFKYGFNPNMIDAGVSKVTEMGGDFILGESPEDTQIDLKDSARYWSDKTGANEKVLEVLFGGVDIATDFNKPAAVFKVVSETTLNLVNAYTYGHASSDLKKEKERSAQLWAVIEEKVKRYIRQDVMELTDKELISLGKLLEVEIKLNIDNN